MRSAVGGAPTSTGPARAEGAGGPAAAGLVARTTDGDLTSEVDWKLSCVTFAIMCHDVPRGSTWHDLALCYPILLYDFIWHHVKEVIIVLVVCIGCVWCIEHNPRLCFSSDISDSADSRKAAGVLNAVEDDPTEALQNNGVTSEVPRQDMANTCQHGQVSQSTGLGFVFHWIRFLEIHLGFGHFFVTLKFNHSFLDGFATDVRPDEFLRLALQSCWCYFRSSPL